MRHQPYGYGRILVLALALAVSAMGCAGIRPPSGVTAVERRMIVTGYCKCGTCCGWERTWYGRPVYAYGPQKGQRKIVGMTASGTMARKGTIAADPKRYPFGTIMYVDGYGYGRVEDVGGAIKGEHIDLYFYTHDEARRWGRQAKTVKVWLPSR